MQLLDLAIKVFFYRQNLIVFILNFFVLIEDFVF